jgi:uncharacterized membrane protein YgdD (TMEM256/DUF423 family)
VKPGWRVFAVLGAAIGLTGVGMAAMGSHLEGGIDNFESYRAWNSAGMMHLVHGLVLLLVAVWLRSHDSGLVRLAGLLMSLGVLMFCGSVYYSVLSGSGTTHGIAPLGGICLMAGWISLGAAALAAKPESE